jgi:NAD(P)H dehydrogenase (quinone)
LSPRPPGEFIALNRPESVVAAVGAGRVASASRADAEGAATVLVGKGHEGKVYEFSGDRAWDYNELADVIAEVTGVPPDGTIADGALSEVSPDLSNLIGRPTTSLKETVKKLAG